jgi:FdhD protein
MTDLSTLPDQRAVTIEINGCPSGVVTCAPDAPKELAVGWAFAWGYLDGAAELGKVTLHGDRVSLMVDGGRDLDRLQRLSSGWEEIAPRFGHEHHQHDDDEADDEPFRITEGRLSLIADRAFERFKEDRGDDGFLHAALADFEVVRCIARDLDARAAIDKVIGWSLLEGVELDGAFLLVRGTVTRQIVQRALRARLALVVSDELATREAVQTAREASLTVVGRALGPDRLLFHDGGHILPDHDTAATTACDRRHAIATRPPDKWPGGRWFRRELCVRRP